MRTTILLISFVILGGLSYVSAQPPTYDDLLILFADEDYEKLLKKAEKYTLDDDSKKDAIPFIFLSRANYEISRNAELRENHPKAFKDAVKFAGKAVKKDKDGSAYREYIDYFLDLKKVLIEELENYLIEADYRKAEGTVRDLLKVDEQDLGAMFMMAYVKEKTGDLNGARTAIQDALKKLDETSSISNLKSDELKLLKMGLTNYSLNAFEGGKTNEAKKVINKGYQWFEEDAEYKEAYDQIVN